MPSVKIWDAAGQLCIKYCLLSGGNPKGGIEPCMATREKYDLNVKCGYVADIETYDEVS